MRIRLCGDQAEVSKALEMLAMGLWIANVSRPYPNRQGSGVRVYVTTQARKPGPAGGEGDR